MLKYISYIISFVVMYFVPFLLYWIFGVVCGLVWFHYTDSLAKKKYGMSLTDFVLQSEKEKFYDLYNLNEKFVNNILRVIYVLNYSFFWPGKFFLDLAEVIKPNSTFTLPPVK